MYHDATTQLQRQFYYMQKFESAWVDTKNFRWIYFKWTILETANLASNPNISSFPYCILVKLWPCKKGLRVQKRNTVEHLHYPFKNITAEPTLKS